MPQGIYSIPLCPGGQASLFSSLFLTSGKITKKKKSGEECLLTPPPAHLAPLGWPDYRLSVIMLKPEVCCSSCGGPDYGGEAFSASTQEPWWVLTQESCCLCSFVVRYICSSGRWYLRQELWASEGAGGVKGIIEACCFLVYFVLYIPSSWVLLSATVLRKQ